MKKELLQCPFDKATTCVQDETCVGCETLGEYFANLSNESPKVDARLREEVKKIMVFYDDALGYGRRKFDIGDGRRLNEYCRIIKAIKEAGEKGKLYED